MSGAHYDALAALFEYPGQDYPEAVRRAIDALRPGHDAAARAIEAFARDLPAGRERLSRLELDDLQELFTRSFDVQAVTTLSVGYVLFGDDYKRGELLVHLGRELRAVGVECGSELPDHLPNVLRLMARWPDGELAREFAEEILQPAVSRMVAEFGPERMERRDRLYEKHFRTLIESAEDRRALFRAPLSAVLSAVREDFALPEWRAPEQDNEFLRSVARELDLESERSPLVQLGTSR